MEFLYSWMNWWSELEEKNALLRAAGACASSFLEVLVATNMTDSRGITGRPDTQIGYTMGASNKGTSEPKDGPPARPRHRSM